MGMRRVKSVVAGNRTVDGAGVNLVRVLGPRTIEDFDPFLMLDAFDSTDPKDYVAGFPLHPHRGIETVTYLIEGEIRHKDSLGNTGVIRSGDSQWMTAGCGILHEEMPQASPRMLGLQFWINLPKKNKMAEPKYRSITKDTAPVVEEDAATIRVMSSSYNGVDGAVMPDYVKAVFLDVSIKPDARWRIKTDPDHTVFLYIFSGSASFEPEAPSFLKSKNAVLFTKGDELTATAGKDGARFVFVSGKPLDEAVAWGGPVVMNTEEELKQAFFELENGTFIKHR